MKASNFLLWIIALSMCWVMIPISLGHGQSEAQAGDDILMVHPTDPTKSVEIKHGSRLKVNLMNGELVKGYLTHVSDSSYNIGTRELTFADTQMVKVDKGEGGRIGGIGGVILGLLGALFGFLIGWAGVYLTQKTTLSADGCLKVLAGILLLALGIVLGGIGVVIIIIGLVAFSVGSVVGRKFDMRKGWRMKH